MRPSSGRHPVLAQRLRALRLEQWPDRRINQADLAAALGVSDPSVSSWESDQKPKIPPLDRLASYATFFATERSVDHVPYRLLPLRQLTSEERERRDALLHELAQLRAQATESATSSDEPGGRTGMSHGLWHFADGGDVTIVCARLPGYLRERMPYADPENPDYSELYTYADPDALIELFGHIRAVNPTSEVKFQIASELTEDELKTHLVLLGGVDWNVVMRETVARLDMPVRQFRREDDEATAGFEVGVDGRHEEFMAHLDRSAEATVLIEDIAHFFRAPSPYNKDRTITGCNGMYSRGVYGAVRALTAPFVRDRNEAYVAQRFGRAEQFSILAKVLIVNGVSVTPEWSEPGKRLHEWPMA